MSEVQLRRFTADDVSPLTRLLHLAYSELAVIGLNFTAATQDEPTTLDRASHGATWLAERDGDLVASLTMTLPPSRSVRELSREASRPGRAWLNQLAVHPAARGEGLASRLWRVGRAWAAAQGVTHVGLDTATPAQHLIDIYTGWGFVHVETIHWPDKTYDSAVLTRPIEPARPPVGEPRPS